jgi:hypothetical protein
VARFSQTIAAKLAGLSCFAAPLIEMHFTSGIVRTWSGIGLLKSTDGREWLGNGGLISVSDVNAAAGFFASALTVTLSGVPDDLDGIYNKLFVADQSEYRYRRIVVLVQNFGSDWQPLDAPWAYWAGEMDRVDSLDSLESESLTLKCETAFASRQKPPFANYTDEDQQARYPGDRLFRFVGPAAEKTIKWPPA